MRQALHEARRLRRILAETRLKPDERAELERQLRRLENEASAIKTGAAAKPESGPGYLGVFDRPDPAEVAAKAEREKTQPKPAEPQKQPALATTTPAAEPAAQPVPLAPEPMSAAEIEDLTKQIAEIADRILRLRSLWATTLSVEVDREAESWLAKLQSLATKLPRDVVERTLGSQMYLVRQPLRDVSKPTITERLQRQIIPPSAPALDMTGTASLIYFAIHSPRAPRPPERRPVGYVPDGLQSFVA